MKILAFTLLLTACELTTAKTAASAWHKCPDGYEYPNGYACLRDGGAEFVGDLVNEPGNEHSLEAPGR